MSTQPRYRSASRWWPTGHLPRATAIGVLSLLLAVSGCGESGAGDDPQAASGGSAGGASLGVDQGSWPADIEGAQALFEQMPETLDGEERRLPQFFGGAAGVTYGRGNEAPTAWTMETGKESPDATATLSFMFGMTLACDKDSYRGTAPQSRWGGGPDADRRGRYGDGEPWWFSCTIDGAEGAPKFTGHAVGWAQGDLGWLITAPDRKSAAAVAHALTDARQQ